MAEFRPVAHAHQKEVYLFLHNLGHYGRPWFPCLKEVGFYLAVVFVSAILSPTQNPLALFRIRLQFGIQGKRAFHLDDMNDEGLPLVSLASLQASWIASLSASPPSTATSIR
jgi:hypothetical protein